MQNDMEWMKKYYTEEQLADLARRATPEVLERGQREWATLLKEVEAARASGVDPASDEAAKAAAVVERQTRHMSRLISDLLDISRITHGKFALDREVTLAGRHPDSDIFLDDITVSRRHAEIARTGDGYVVRDVGTLNGTYLTRERIDGTSFTGMARSRGSR